MAKGRREKILYHIESGAMSKEITDHLKMCMIHCGNTELTPEDDDSITISCHLLPLAASC